MQARGTEVSLAEQRLEKVSSMFCGRTRVGAKFKVKGLKTLFMNNDVVSRTKRGPS